ncbi:MAG: hypothetical protein ACYC0Z_16885, partial [Acidobacteriaceae bacterium]
MVHEAAGQMAHGYERAKQGIGEIGGGQVLSGLGDVAVGAGGAAIGAAGYVGAPLAAPVHTIVGEPTKHIVGAATGSPRAGELAGSTAELAATAFAPIPKEIPHFGAEAEKLGPTIEAMKAAAKAGFQSSAIRDLTFEPRVIQNWAEITKAHLGSLGLDDIIAPKTWAIVKKLDEAPADATMTGSGLQTLRRTLGKAAAAADPSERLAAVETMHALDQFVEHLPATDVISGDPTKAASVWKEARDNYATAKHAELVRTATEHAKDRTGATYSGQNIDNVTRQEIRRILDNPKLLRGFTQEEQQQMRLIDRGTWKGDLPRFIGNLLGGGGGFPSVIVAGAGAAAAGPGGAAAPLLGYAFKKLGNTNTARRVAELDRMIRARSPLGEQTRAAAEDYGATARTFDNDPTP